jgi:hypothetical protein
MSIVCDVYVDLDNNPTVADGTAVTTTHLANGTRLSGGASGKWALSGANTKLIGAHKFPLFDTVIVRGVGTFAPGHTSRSLRLDTTAGTMYAELDLTAFAKSQVSMGCWIQSNVPYSGGPGALYDIVEIVAGITGNITNFQFCDGTTVGGGSDYCFNSETTGGGSVHWGITNWPHNAAGIAPPGTPLWATIYSDIINGVNKIAIYTPEGRQVTLASGTYTGSGTDTSGTLHRWGNQEVGAVAGGLIFEHMVVDYTSAIFPLIPSEWQGSAYSAGSVIRRRAL